MIRKRMAIVFALAFIFTVVGPLGTAKAGTPWEKWFSNGTVETRPARYISVYSAELVGYVDWKNRHGGQDLVLSAHFKYIDLTDSSRGWQSVTVTPVPTRGGEYAEELKGLVPGHTYQFYTYVKMTSSGSHEDSAHSQTFTTIGGNGSPWSAYSSDGVVATSQASGIGKYEAVLRGHVEWRNRHGMIDLVRDAHFKYIDLTDSSQGWQSVTVTPVPSGGGDYSVRLQGLAPGHTYEYYTYLNMTMSGGHEDSAHKQKFTTEKGTGTPWSAYSSSGIVATMAVENVTQYSADLKGYVEWRNKNGMIDLVKGAYFWYTDNTNKYAGERTVVATSLPSNGGYFTAHLSGLVPGHTYMFHACVDMTVSGSHNNVKDMQSFTTQPGEAGSWQPPSVNSGGKSDGVLATLPVTNVGQYSADLNCHVEWQNKSNIIFEKDYITELGFCYSDGAITGKTTQASKSLFIFPLYTSGGDYTVHLKGLQPGHTYTCYPYVEMVGTDPKWMSEAPKVTFTTLPGTGTPWSDNSSIGIISTLPADNVTDSSAVLRGHVEWENQHYLKNLVGEAGFKYQDITSGEKDWKTKRVILPPTSGGDFSATVSGLTKGHAYRFYPYAAMTMGGTYEDSLHAFVFTAGGGKTLTIKANLPTGVVGKGYSGTLTASGGDGNYTYSGTITAWDSSIPKGDGLSLYPNGGISGAPVAATPTSPQDVPLQVWVTVTDGSGNTGIGSFTIDVIDELRITTTSLPGSLTGVPYRTSDGKTVALTGAGGQGPYSWSGTITPANGLTFNTDGSINGTPQAAVTSNVHALLKDSAGRIAEANLILPVFEPLKIATAALPGGTVGSGYQTPDGKPVKLSAAGGYGRYTWSGTITPANGFNLTPDGSINGTPLSPVTSTVNVTVSDGSGSKASGSFKINVYNKLQITTDMLPGGLTEAAYQTSDGKAVILSAEGGDGKYTWSGTITPANGTLQVTADGKITGTPAAVTGNKPLSVQAVVKDGSGNIAKASFLALINDPLPAGIVGQLYKIDLAGSGGDGKYTWSGTITPANGTLQVTADGKITGTPAAVTGNKPLSVQAVVKDDSGKTGGISLCLSVLDKNAQPLTITTTDLPEAAAGQSYSSSLAASGGDGRYTWSGNITPANGLTLNASGSITGTPQSAIASTVNATVSDSSGNRAKAQFNIRPKGVITLNLAETTIDMDNNSQLKCFFTVSPADAMVSASSNKTGTASCVLGGTAGNYCLTLTAGNPTNYYDTVATIAVSASKTGFTGITRSFNVRVPYKAPEMKKTSIGGGLVIPVFIPVTNITSLPDSTDAGTDLTLTGTVEPDNATNKDIVWSIKNAGDTGAAISGNTFSAPEPGTVTLTATIANGSASGTDYTQDFTITVNPAFVPVTNITGVPDSATAGTDLILTDTVEPDNATNQTIVWCIKDAGNTGVEISDNTFSAPEPGTVTLTATVANGKALGTDYTEDFTITVNPAFVPVTGITGVPSAAIARTDLTLTGAVEPDNATNQTIVWCIKDAGNTGAEISDNTFSAPEPGTVTLTATIANGSASGTDYTQDFTITVNPAFVPVTNITGVPDSATAGTDLTLTGTVEPDNATNKDIVWSIKQDEGTEAELSGNTLKTGGSGTVTLTATVTNGKALGTDYTEDFTITVNPAFVPVTGITGVPSAAIARTDLTLTGTVEPDNATNKDIVWSIKNAGDTGAAISGNTFSAPEPGTVTLTATIANGSAPGTDYTQHFVITVNPAFVPVENITGVPDSATAGTDLILTGTVEPDNATNQTIVWSIKDAGNTGAAISGNTFSAPEPGTVTLTATIANGSTPGTDYTQDFVITVAPAFVPVMNITGVPTTATAGTDLILTGTVEPDNATNQTIVWSIKDAGDTGAEILGNTLSVPEAGTVTLTATITNGAAPGTDYAQDFTINVAPAFVPVENITGVPDSTTAGTDLTLTGTVEPDNATNKDIVWSIKDAGNTGAEISDNTFSASEPGTVTLTATIANGSAPDTDYTQDFTIAVIG